MVTDIKKYIFDKLFFPKVVMMNKPGTITNKAVGKFGKEGVKTRIIYDFEDIGINLSIKTSQKLGKEKTEDLWYKIGKEMTSRYFLFLERQEIPKILIPLILEHIFNTFSSAGMSFAEELKYNQKEKLLITKGKNCAKCRKTKNGAVMAGIVSGILSSLLRENIEAENLCKDCPNDCKIIANPKIKNKHAPDINEIKPQEEYHKLNFSLQEHKTNLNSFTDLIKFRKINIDNQGKTSFYDRTIIPSEIGLPEIMFKNYIQNGEKELFEESIIQTSKEIIKEIIIKEKISDTKEKLKILLNMLSAFGWGIPYYKEKEKRVIFNFINPPITKYGPQLRHLILQGYLEGIYNKKIQVKNSNYGSVEFIY